VLARSPREVIFTPGQLTQFFHSSIHSTLEAKRKLLPKWSTPCRVMERLCNSYRLENLDGVPIPGEFHARCLRAFIPKEGTKLAEEQRQREEEQMKATAEEINENQEQEDKERVEENQNEAEEDETEEDSDRNSEVLGEMEIDGCRDIVEEDMVDEDVSVFEGGMWSGGPLGRRVAEVRSLPVVESICQQ
jgi:hypothetical protein